MNMSSVLKISLCCEKIELKWEKVRVRRPSGAPETASVRDNGHLDYSGGTGTEGRRWTQKHLEGRIRPDNQVVMGNK